MTSRTSSRSKAPAPPQSKADGASDSSSVLRFSAALGCVVWLGHRVLVDTDLISSTLAVAVLVVVPLGLSLVTLNARQAKLFGGLYLLQPFAAAGAVLALSLEARGATGLFAAPWAAFTVGVGVVGAFGLADRAPGRELAHTLALLSLPAGGVWLFVARAGFDPLDNGVLVVLLTAVHFHFAAFAALIVMGCNNSRLRGLIQRGDAPAVLEHFGRGAAWAVPVGYVLVAVGIARLPLVGVFGAVLLTGALFVHAALHLLFVVRHQRGGLVRLFSCVSSASVLVSMPLACAWALGEWTDSTLIDFTSMLRLHGMANAHGFVLAGLVGFWLDARAREGERIAAESVSRANRGPVPEPLGSESP